MMAWRKKAADNIWDLFLPNLNKDEKSHLFIGLDVNSIMKRAPVPFLEARAVHRSSRHQIKPIECQILSDSAISVTTTGQPLSWCLRFYAKTSWLPQNRLLPASLYRRLSAAPNSGYRKMSAAPSGYPMLSATPNFYLMNQPRDVSIICSKSNHRMRIGKLLTVSRVSHQLWIAKIALVPYLTLQTPQVGSILGYVLVYC